MADTGYIQLQPDHVLEYGETVYANCNGGKKFAELKMRGRYRKEAGYYFEESEAEFNDYRRVMKLYLKKGWLYYKSK